MLVLDGEQPGSFGFGETHFLGVGLDLGAVRVENVELPILLNVVHVHSF